MSNAVFIIRNQLGQYWIRAGEWVDGREPQRVLRFKYRDEAVNQLVELSAKDIELRAEVLQCDAGERDELKLEASEHLTPTLAERAAARAAAEREAAQALAAAGEEANPEESGAAADDGEEPASATAV
jgi:hypothetical protein